VYKYSYLLTYLTGRRISFTFMFSLGPASHTSSQIDTERLGWNRSADQPSAYSAVKSNFNAARASIVFERQYF